MQNEEPPFQVRDTATRGGTSFDLLEYGMLGGTSSVSLARELHDLNRSGTRLRQIRIRLQDGAVRTEPGALQFLRGNLDMQSTTGTGSGVGGLLLGAINAARTGETVFKPLYRGTGEMYLEPRFGHFWMMQLTSESVIADQGMFYACEDSIRVEVFRNNLSASVAGGEGRYQTKLTGSGIVVFEIPVPQNEILEFTLQNDTLRIDGSFALLRTGNIQFSVEKSSKSLVGSATSGEGLLQVFRGTGTVWLAPTKPVYDRMQGLTRV